MPLKVIFNQEEMKCILTSRVWEEMKYVTLKYVVHNHWRPLPFRDVHFYAKLLGSTWRRSNYVLYPWCVIQETLEQGWQMV